MSKDIHEIATEIADLVSDRQKTYGDSFGNAGKILEVLYPNGVKADQYTDVLSIARILDKLFRIANGQYNDSYRDIAGYALLGERRFQETQIGGKPTFDVANCLECGESRGYEHVCAKTVFARQPTQEEMDVLEAEPVLPYCKMCGKRFKPSDQHPTGECCSHLCAVAHRGHK